MERAYNGVRYMMLPNYLGLKCSAENDAAFCSRKITISVTDFYIISYMPHYVTELILLLTEAETYW